MNKDINLFKALLHLRK